MNTALLVLIVVITAVLAYNIGAYYGQKELEDNFEIISKERDYYKYTPQYIIEENELSDKYLREEE
jgi:hypothetical protein